MPPKTWQLLHILRCSTRRITALAQAVLCLHAICSS